MTGRPRSASDDAIFDAVAAVVTAAGPSGLTLAAVAERVGLSAPALAQRFRSKRGLLVAFATQAATNVAEPFAAARAADPDPLNALVAALAAGPGDVARRATREGLANHLAFLQMDLTDPELRPQAVAHSRALRTEIADLVADAVNGGLLTAGTVPGVLATDLWVAYNGAMVTWAIDGTGELSDWIRDHLQRVIAPHRLRQLRTGTKHIPAPGSLE